MKQDRFAGSGPVFQLKGRSVPIDFSKERRADMQAGNLPGKMAVIRSEADRENCAGSLFVYILGKNERGLYGMAVGEGMEQPAEFAGTDRLVLLIAGMCGDAAFSYPALLGGGLLAEMGKGGYALRYRAKELLQVTVTGRRNDDVQGRVKGMFTGGKYVYFRSALELLRVLDELPV